MLFTAGEDSAFTVEHHDTEDGWKAGNSDGIGASEVASAMGLNEYFSPYALWAQKTGLAPRVDEENDAMEWGRILEEPIAQKYARETGRQLIDHGRFTRFRSKKWQWLTCTLDREVVAWNELGPAALEIKSTDLTNADHWIEEPPLRVQIQLQTQLAVTGWKHGSIAVLAGYKRFRWCDVPRNDDFIAVLVEKTRRFWKLVETRKAPDVDGHDSTTEALKRMFPSEQATTVELPIEAAEWDEQRRIACEEIKKFEEKKTEAENKIRAAIGDASFGALPGGGRYSLKTVNRKESVVKATSYRSLRRYEK